MAIGARLNFLKRVCDDGHLGLDWMPQVVDDLEDKDVAVAALAHLADALLLVKLLTSRAVRVQDAVTVLGNVQTLGDALNGKYNRWLGHLLFRFLMNALL